MKKAIAITGNTGKTALSYFLGRELSVSHNQICVMISTNDFMPVMQLLTERKSTTEKSLGKLLACAIITQEDVTQNVIRFKGNANFGYLSYAKGETANSYPKATETNILRFFELLQSIVDFVIIDMQSPMNDIDKVLAPLCDNTYCTLSADIKGIAYYNGLVNKSATNIVLLNNHPYNPLDEVERTFEQNTKYTLPFCKEIQSIHNGIELTEVSPKKAYLKVIQKMAQEVLSID